MSFLGRLSNVVSSVIPGIKVIVAATPIYINSDIYGIISANESDIIKKNDFFANIYELIYTLYGGEKNEMKKANKLPSF